MILDTLAESTRKRVEARKLITPLEKIKRKASLVGMGGFEFENALKKDSMAFICEVKKASPSKGIIAERFPYLEIASEYYRAGADAISVLTEPEYFKGNIEFVKDIKSKFSIPVLRKDFTVDEYQIYEAKLYGADAILLIMAALTDAEYKKFHALADSIGLDVLVETHNEEEVKRAVEYGSIIGVNNRNLQTFDEDITTCERLLPLIPAGKVKVAESAIRKHSDFEYLRGLKFDAALIGEAFMREKDIKKAVDNLRYGN